MEADPLPGILFSLALLLVVLSKKSGELKKLSCCVFVLIALLAIPTYLTGEGAEEVVEHLPGVEHELIEEHEESALVSLVAIEVLGQLSLAQGVISGSCLLAVADGATDEKRISTT